MTQTNPHFDLSAPAEASAFALMCPYSFKFAVTWDDLTGIGPDAGMTLDHLVPELVFENNDYTEAGTV